MSLIRLSRRGWMKRVVVIGLGIFGFNIAKDLYENGFEVVAVDKNKEAIQKIRGFSTKAVLADGTDKEVIESIGIQPDDVVIVSFGEDLAASTLNHSPSQRDEGEEPLLSRHPMRIINMS